MVLHKSRRACVFLGLMSGTLIVPLREATTQARPPRPLPQAAYQSLDSLEEVALTGTTFRARQHAVSTITSIGIGQGNCVRGPAPTDVKYPGLVRRLASIFWRSQDTELRRSILALMLWQVECTDAVEFLAEVAQQAPSASEKYTGTVRDGVRVTLQADAVSILLNFGPRGEQVLRRLHSQGSVRDSSARASLDSLSRNGFRRPN